MRILFLITLLLSTVVSSAQYKMDSIVSTALCQCMHQSKILTDDSFLDCLTIAMEENNDELLKECYATYKDTSSETAYKFGQELYSRICVSLVYSCKPYFILMDTLRYSDTYHLNKDSVRQVLRNTNQKDTTNWDSDLFIKRGLMYFQLKDLEKALFDFSRSVELNKNSLQGLYFKALTLELLNKYDAAYTIFLRLADQTRKKEFYLCAAIIERKKKGD